MAGPKLIHVARPGRYMLVDSESVVVRTFDSGSEAMEEAEILAKLHAGVYKVYDRERTEDD